MTTVGLSLFGPAYGQPHPHHVNLPKPSSSGDKTLFLPEHSATAPDAPTLGVIGGSVARDYAYYLARELGPAGVRVVDAATIGCPASTVQVLLPHRGRLSLTPCPKIVLRKETAMVAEFRPRVVLWHSIQERFGVVVGTVRRKGGSPEWERAVMAGWDDTLARVTSRGAKVVLVLPLWLEGRPAVPLTVRAGSIDRLRDMYRRWAGRHRDKVTLVDVAPFVCPSGPPCGPVNGIDFRPDQLHFDDPGGERLAAYLRAHVPDLAHLVPR